MNSNPIYVTGYTDETGSVTWHRSTSYGIAVDALIRLMEGDYLIDIDHQDAIGDAIATFAHCIRSEELIEVTAGDTTYWVGAE